MSRTRISLPAQIAYIEGEMRRRQAGLPARVLGGKLTSDQAMADYTILRAVKASLEQLEHQQEPQS